MEKRSETQKQLNILTLFLAAVLIFSAIAILTGCSDDTTVNNTAPVARNMYLEIYYDNGSRIELRQYSCSLFKSDAEQVYITTDTGVVTLDRSKVVGHECKPQ